MIPMPPRPSSRSTSKLPIVLWAGAATPSRRLLFGQHVGRSAPILLEHELEDVLADLDAVAALEVADLDLAPVQEDAVHAAEIAHAEAGAGKLDHGVLPGHGAVLEAEVGLGPAADREGG